MLKIALPDGSERHYNAPVTAAQIAADIGSGLAKAAIAAVVNGENWDINRVINVDSEIRLITFKDDYSLELIRHDCAHILAEAVLELFPETQVTIGPAIETGFYYDFYRKSPFSTDDLATIEQRMHEIVDRDEEITRGEWSREEAIRFYKDRNEPFKIELVDAIPEKETVSYYQQGNFIDLCRGPHMVSTKKVGHAFKLMKVAGAYWRGDSNNPMLQRIYGTAFASQADLQAYLNMLEEAEKRDHRKLGNELDLFTSSEELGSGNFLWKPKGAVLRDVIETYSKNAHLQNGYSLVNTPHIGKSILWETSGHLEHYKENMFPPLNHIENNESYYLKPMNCPFHILVYKSDLHSYKELPLRYFEFGSVYRYEKTGVLHGLLRLRGFTQDDAHIFCTTEQINDEVKTLLSFSVNLLGSYGLTEIEADLSTKPKKYIGSDKDWEIATNSLKQSLTELEVPFQTAEGEGAFYGPKIDLHAKDAIGRRWQLSTIQIDFAQPDNFDIEYVNSDNKKSRPVMIHRALLGSVERFTAVLLEHYAGYLPGWLSPTQVDILTIGDVDKYAQTIINDLRSYRVNLDSRNIRLGEKLHNSEKSKTPIQIIIGEKDSSNNTMAVNIFGKENLKDVEYKKAIRSIKKWLKEPEFSLDG